ncbi:MAG: AbrB/MazE/SpoVT family DNA-binding domain-containing protein [Candidatus Omnitrophica bacterium]|nr:AbrB/MazE/SpoVT family DNA-binding domain-containing protein [Candidatus Omnitrophota bacterium]
MSEVFKGPHGDFHSVVTVGERGQVVVPADIRKQFNIKSGDKLVVFAKPQHMIGLVPADDFNRFLTEATKVLSKIKSRL